MRRRLLFLTVALWAAGCPAAPDRPRYEGAGSATPVRGGEFTFWESSNVRGLDPHKSFDALSNMGIRLVFDGLLDYDHEARLVPSLAESLPEISPDGLRYTFRLRRGVRFHNGRELTADDVRWSLTRMLDPKTASPGWPFFANIEGVKEFREGSAKTVHGIRVVDPHTIAVTLETPDQTFSNAMAMTFAYPVPRENYERWGAEVDRHPIGTGPFRFVSWERGVRLVFERNEQYWQPDKPYVDRMVYLENLDRNAALMRFRNGEVDVAHGFPAADYLFFKNSEAWKPYLVEEPNVSIHGIFMNCEMAPFDNVHVRRAVAHAIDRERWSRSRNHRLLPAGQLLPPQLVGFREDLPHLQRFDLKKAKEEMRRAGFPNGLPNPVTLWVGESPSARFYGELAQADLAKIGIRVNIRQVAFAVYLKETGKPGRVQMAFTGWNQDFPDPADFLDILFHSRSIHEEDAENRAFYRNPELDRILDEARIERDKERRRALYEEANDIVARDAPWAFTYYPLDMEGWQPYVRGYRPHPVWSKDYRSVWLDLPRRRVVRNTMENGPSMLGAATRDVAGRETARW